jgi:hypothetical protein
MEIIMAIRLPVNSRYRLTDVVMHQNSETLAWWSGADWIDESPIATIMATSGLAGRLDLIATKYLGSPDLWWVIMYYNKVTDINWPYAGDLVAIPPTNAILRT